MLTHPIAGELRIKKREAAYSPPLPVAFAYQNTTIGKPDPCQSLVIDHACCLGFI